MIKLEHFQESGHLLLSCNLYDDLPSALCHFYVFEPDPSERGFKRRSRVRILCPDSGAFPLQDRAQMKQRGNERDRAVPRRAVDKCKLFFDSGRK